MVRQGILFAAIVLLSARAVFADRAATADLLVVQKSVRQLLVYRNGEVVRSYRVALGSSPVGPKLKQGDGRTPEGRYTIDGRNERSSYYLALHISYPAAKDIAAATRAGLSPGGDIMIHGLPNGVAAVGENEDWTRGCIAVTNQAIEELWQMVNVGTPIEIRP